MSGVKQTARKFTGLNKQRNLSGKEKPAMFVCQYNNCEKDYQYKSSLTRHIKVGHAQRLRDQGQTAEGDGKLVAGPATAKLADAAKEEEAGAAMKEGSKEEEYIETLRSLAKYSEEEIMQMRQNVKAKRDAETSKKEEELVPVVVDIADDEDEDDNVEGCSGEESIDSLIKGLVFNYFKVVVPSLASEFEAAFTVHGTRLQLGEVVTAVTMNKENLFQNKVEESKEGEEVQEIIDIADADESSEIEAEEGRDASLKRKQGAVEADQMEDDEGVSSGEEYIEMHLQMSRPDVEKGSRKLPEPFSKRAKVAAVENGLGREAGSINEPVARLVKTFTCTGCGTQFEGKSSLRLHIGEVHDEVGGLVSQLSKAFPGGSFACVFCKKVCSSVYETREHVVLRHPWAALEELVDICEFEVNGQMEVEVGCLGEVHGEVDDMKCKDCGFEAATGRGLRRHIRDHNTLGWNDRKVMKYYRSKMMKYYRTNASMLRRKSGSKQQQVQDLPVINVEDEEEAIDYLLCDLCDAKVGKGDLKGHMEIAHKGDIDALSDLELKSLFKSG